MILTVIWSI